MSSRAASFTLTTTGVEEPRASVTSTVMERLVPALVTVYTVPLSRVAEEAVAVTSMETTRSPLVTRPTV